MPWWACPPTRNCPRSSAPATLPMKTLNVCAAKALGDICAISSRATSAIGLKRPDDCGHAGRLKENNRWWVASQMKRISSRCGRYIDVLVTDEQAAVSVLRRRSKVFPRLYCNGIIKPTQRRILFNYNTTSLVPSPASDDRTKARIRQPSYSFHNLNDSTLSFPTMLMPPKPPPVMREPTPSPIAISNTASSFARRFIIVPYRYIRFAQQLPNADIAASRASSDLTSHSPSRSAAPCGTVPVRLL